jgi:lipase chaperone LimK
MMNSFVKITGIGLAGVLAGLALVAIMADSPSIELSDAFDETSKHSTNEAVKGSLVQTIDTALVEPGNYAASRLDVLDWQSELPSQFEGTDVLGRLITDQDGNLIVDEQARQLLDYFLSAQDDAPITQITAWLESYFDQHLVSPAREQASLFLANYLEYKTRLNALTVDQDLWARLYDPSEMMTQSDLASLTRVFEERKALQQQLFDQADQEALFGSENIYDDYMLQRMKISTSGLSNEDVANQLAALDAQQPDHNQSERQASQLALNHKSLRQQVSTAGQGEQYQTYAQTYGDEAAERLMALESKRQAFQQKRADYLSYRESLGEDASPQALDEYMRFELQLSDGEIQRMKTLDRITH